MSQTVARAAVSAAALAIVWLAPMAADTLSRQTEHFRGFYDGSDPAVLGETLRAAEEGLSSAALLTGVPEPSQRVLLMLYAHVRRPRTSAQGNGSGLRVGGAVLPYDAATQVTMVLDGSVEGGLPRTLVRHEAAHALVVSYLGENSSRIPWWLSEGIAQIAAGEDMAPPATLTVALRKVRLVPLARLDSPRVNLRASDLRTAYAESASAVRHLAGTHGRGALRDILRRIAAGESFEDAFESTTRRSVGTFEREWLGEVRAEIAGRSRTRVVAVGLMAGVALAALAVFLRSRRTRSRAVVPDDGDH